MNWITHDGWKFAALGGDGIDRVLAMSDDTLYGVYRRGGAVNAHQLATGSAGHLATEALRYVSEFGGGDALSIAPDVALMAIARVAG